MFDGLRVTCACDTQRLQWIGLESQDCIWSILDNQGSLNRRVSILEAMGATQGVDLVRLEQLEGACQMIQHLVEDLSQRVEFMEGLLDWLWEGNLDDLRLFCQITERVEEVHDNRDKRLQMVLE